MCFFHGRNLLKRSLYSFNLAIFWLCVQRDEAFTMLLSEIALPSALCRSVLRTKSKLQRRIVKCHHSREIFSRIYLLFPILEYSFAEWKCARDWNRHTLQQDRLVYLITMKTCGGRGIFDELWIRERVYMNSSTFRDMYILCKCTNDICNIFQHPRIACSKMYNMQV